MTTLALTHGEPSNGRLERGLAPHGVDCVTVDPAGGPLDRSVAVDATVGLVFPSRLPEGVYLDAVSDLSWIVGPGDLLRSRNKAATAALCRDAGLRVPETRLLSHPTTDDDVREAVADLSFPVVAKQNAGTQGRGAVLVHDADSLLGVADQYATIHRGPVFDKTLVVQEYVPEARDLRVMVTDGRYVGAVERRSESWAKNVHRGAVAAPVEPSEAVVDAAERAATAVGLAFSGVDVLVADGEPWVLELNAKPTVDDPGLYEDDFFDRLAGLVRSLA